MGEFHLPRGAGTIQELEARISRVVAAMESRMRAMRGLDGSTVRLYGPVEAPSVSQAGTTGTTYLTRDDAISNALYVSGGKHRASRPIEAPVFRSAERADQADELVRFDQLEELLGLVEENQDETEEAIGGVTTTAATRTVHLAFRSPAAAFGTYYFGGFYLLGTPDSNFGAPVAAGSVNSSYGARVWVVAGGTPATTVSLTVAGTSVSNAGVRTGGDSEVISVPTTAVAGSFYQTAKRWIGQVTITRTGGPALLCNWGLAAFEDNGAVDFTVLGVEAAWLAGATDAGADIRLHWHRATGWTYNAGAAAMPPAALAAMATDHAPERSTIAGEQGSWRHRPLAQAVNADSGEGILVSVVTTVAAAFEAGNVAIQIRSA